MREIKFRAWDKDNRCFFRPTYRAYQGNLEYLTLGMTGRLGLVGMEGTDDESLFPNRFELMQYTGLKDELGLEVWEHDIVKDPFFYGLWLVEWDNSNAGFYLKLLKSPITNEIPSLAACRITDFQLVGNSHENPELLEEE